MKYPDRLLREKTDLRTLRRDAELRDPLLPLRRTFDDAADEWVGHRLGWQPTRPFARIPRRPTAA